MPASKISRRQLKKDLDWAFHRLSHVLFVYKYPFTVPGHFGFADSMRWIAERLPEMEERYGYGPTWPQELDKPVKKAAGFTKELTELFAEYTALEDAFNEKFHAITGEDLPEFCAAKTPCV